MPSPFPITAGRVASLVGGELVGAPGAILVGAAPLERAGPSQLSVLASVRYLPQFRSSQAGAVLIARAFRDEARGPGTRILVSDPHAALEALVGGLDLGPRPPWGIDSSARIGRGSKWSGRIAIAGGARIGSDVRFGADCVIGPDTVIEDGARFGTACRIEAGAVIHYDVHLGDRVVIRTGARVGGRGFGFRLVGGEHRRVPQLGGCMIGDDVEIGACTTVDRGGLDDTVIGSGTKIDNLVQIAHNVRVGRRCVIMAQVGIAGSTVVEDEVMLAGQAGLADHLTVGRGARVAAQSGVIGDIAPGATVSGYPARDHRAVLRQTAALARLAPLVSALERTVAQHDSG